MRAKTPLHYISGILLRTGDATIYYHDLHVKIAGETGEWLMAKFRDQKSNEARKLLDGVLGTFPPERRLKEAEEAITRLANEETLEAQIAKLRAMSSEELAKVEI